MNGTCRSAPSREPVLNCCAHGASCRLDERREPSAGRVGGPHPRRM